MADRCENCTFSRKGTYTVNDKPVRETILCCRNPPTAQFVTWDAVDELGHISRHVDPKTAWPTVKAGDWCGEFRPMSPIAGGTNGT